MCVCVCVYSICVICMYTCSCVFVCVCSCVGVCVGVCVRYAISLMQCCVQLSNGFKKMIRGLLARDPGKRLGSKHGAAELKRCEFLQEVFHPAVPLFCYLPIPLPFFNEAQVCTISFLPTYLPRWFARCRAASRADEGDISLLYAQVNKGT